MPSIKELSERVGHLKSRFGQLKESL